MRRRLFVFFRKCSWHSLYIGTKIEALVCAWRMEYASHSVATPHHQWHETWQQLTRGQCKFSSYNCCDTCRSIICPLFARTLNFCCLSLSLMQPFLLAICFVSIIFFYFGVCTRCRFIVCRRYRIYWQPRGRWWTRPSLDPWTTGNQPEAWYSQA